MDGRSRMTTQAKNEQFKPCPFCGKRPELTYYINGDVFEVGVRCSACRIEKQRIEKLVRIPKTNPAYLLIEAEREAIDDWNQRAGND